MEQPNALIERMQQGDEKAFAEIYSRYSKAIFGVIHTILHDTEASEEVLQDTFMKAWKNASSYAIGKGRFYTWLLNIARNAAIDKTRSKEFKNTQKNLSTTNFVDIIATTDNLNRKTNAIGLKAFVNALQPACIKIIEYLYFKGYTQADTADELEIPLGTVKTRARTCMNDLRKLVGVDI